MNFAYLGLHSQVTGFLMARTLDVTFNVAQTPLAVIKVGRWEKLFPCKRRSLTAQ
jgi:hypothetical protein